MFQAHMGLLDLSHSKGVSKCMLCTVHFYLSPWLRGATFISTEGGQPALLLNICASILRHMYKFTARVNVRMKMVVQKSGPPKPLHSTTLKEVFVFPVRSDH